MEIIEDIAKELCPISLRKFVSKVSYRTGLSLRKISDDYVRILIDIGFLTLTKNTLFLNEKRGEQENAL
jgi:hypothetical protein